MRGDRADVEYVRNLHLAASTSEADVTRAIVTLLERAAPFDFAAVQSLARPIVSELYLLDTEIGRNYFDEVIGPEFKSAAIGVFARTSYQDLQRKNAASEDEVEKQLRDRLKGRHIEISSVLIQKVTYAPEILQSERERVVSQEQTLRNMQLMENEALEKKRRSSSRYLPFHSAQRPQLGKLPT